MSNQHKPIGVTLLDENVTQKTHTKPFFVADLDKFSLQIKWTGSANMAMALQTTNDPIAYEEPDSARWFTEATTITGCNGAVANGSVLLHFNNINSSACRVSFTPTVTGTISVYGTGR